MLKIYFAFIHRLPSAEAIHEKLLTLPLHLQQKILTYKNPWDSVLQLSSKLLLQELIHQFGLDNPVRLDDLQISKNGKPHFNNALYFGTAHAGKIAVCAASTTGDVGIDIEEIKPVDLADYKEYFTVKEWQYINSSNNAINNFLMAWTRKEAILKASGDGIYEDFVALEVLENEVFFKGVNYYLHVIDIAEGYVCHIATIKPNLETEIKAIKLFEE